MHSVLDLPTTVLDQTRAALCRGSIVSPSSEALADALCAWVRDHGGNSGDLSLQFILHGEDPSSSEWVHAAFVVGVVIHEAFGLDRDHRVGLEPGELSQRVTRADALLEACEASLAQVLERHQATRSARALYFVVSGPLCSGRLVKGTWRDDLDDDERFFTEVPGPDEPWLERARQGASPDDAPGGVLGYTLCQHIYDNSTPPIEVTAEMLNSFDPLLNQHGLERRTSVLPSYD